MSLLPPPPPAATRSASRVDDRRRQLVRAPAAPGLVRFCLLDEDEIFVGSVELPGDADNPAVHALVWQLFEHVRPEASHHPAVSPGAPSVRLALL